MMANVSGLSWDAKEGRDALGTDWGPGEAGGATQRLVVIGVI